MTYIFRIVERIGQAYYDLYVKFELKERFSPDCSGSLVGYVADSALYKGGIETTGTQLYLGAVPRTLLTTSVKLDKLQNQSHYNQSH